MHKLHFCLLAILLCTTQANAQYDSSKTRLSDSLLTFRKGKLYLGDSLINESGYDHLFKRYTSSANSFQFYETHSYGAGSFALAAIIGIIVGLKQLIFNQGTNAGKSFEISGFSIGLTALFAFFQNSSLKHAVKHYNTEVSK